MSPLPRVGRRTLALVAVSMVLVLGFLAAIGGPVAGQEGAAAKITRVVTIGVIDSGCPGGKDPCWDTTVLIANPGETVQLVANLTPSTNTHNLHVKGISPEQKTAVAPSQIHTVNFTMPDNGGVTYICDVHPTMSGKVLTPAQFATQAKAGGETEVPSLGVHFLAYWVGVIAFALLFLVYGITFFIFKYNETAATTDHWDRTGGDGQLTDNARLRGGKSTLVAIGVAIVVIAAIVFLARRYGG